MNVQQKLELVTIDLHTTQQVIIFPIHKLLNMGCSDKFPYNLSTATVPIQLYNVQYTSHTQSLMALEPKIIVPD